MAESKNTIFCLVVVYYSIILMLWYVAATNFLRTLLDTISIDRAKKYEIAYIVQ